MSADSTTCPNSPTISMQAADPRLNGIRRKLTPIHISILYLVLLLVKCCKLKNNHIDIPSTLQFLPQKSLNPPKEWEKSRKWNARNWLPGLIRLCRFHSYHSSHTLRELGGGHGYCVIFRHVGREFVGSNRSKMSIYLSLLKESNSDLLSEIVFNFFSFPRTVEWRMLS